VHPLTLGISMVSRSVVPWIQGFLFSIGSFQLVFGCFPLFELFRLLMLSHSLIQIEVRY
jgi:hypothetical protein